MAAFKKGDRVAWHHSFAAVHAAGSIVRAAAVPTLDKNHPLHGEPGTGQFGTVAAVANEEGTWFEVQLDGEKKPRVLTAEELVAVKEDE